MKKLANLFLASILLFSACENDDNIDSQDENNNTNSEIQVNDTIYVNASSNGSVTGTSWENAFTDLQAALTVATEGNTIWVAAGTYYPTSGTDRSVSFEMVDGVAVYGGFAGGELNIDSRDWELNKTILSGDIGSSGISDDNTAHVVKGADNAILDGFIIEKGNAMGVISSGGSGGGGGGDNHTSPEAIMSSNGDMCGGGILNFQVAAVYRNIIVQDCYAAKGGAVYNMTTSTFPPSMSSRSATPVFINVSFLNNEAFARGGAMSNDLMTNPVIVNCLFDGNYCASKGGAIYNDFGCSPVILNTAFTDNYSYMAAALGNDGSSNPLLVNVSITDNSVGDRGAGLYQGSYNASSSAGRNTAYIINSTITNNTSETHGLVSVNNWGESWVQAYNCNIDNWEHENTSLGSTYSSLISAASNAESMSADEIQNDYLNLFINSMVKMEPGEMSDFGSYTVIKEVTIPTNVIYVNVNANGSDNGSSWTDAYTDLQDGIDAAFNVDGGEVWVAAGTYLPGDDRTSSFQTRAYVAIYGGFSGNETEKSQRNYDVNETILSGDIGATGVSTDNCYHVIKGSINSIIDGVVVEGGYADGEVFDGMGGGMFNTGNSASVIVKNSEFRNNYAFDGGAIMNFFDVYSYYDNVTFTDNSAEIGGAVSCRSGSSILIENSLFDDNASEYRAGALLINYGSNVGLSNVEFTSNTTKGNGGAIWTDDQASQYGGTSPVIAGCTFTNNSAEYYGGAIHIFDMTTATLSSSTFSGNSAQYGNDIAATLTATVTITGTSADTYTDDTSKIN